MRIDYLKTTPDRAGRYFVKFEDESTMRLYRQTVEDFGLYTGKELSDEEMAALRVAAGRMSAKMRAVRIVSASSVTKRDLEQRLVRKGEDPTQAKEAVEWMSDLSLLDDAKVAEQVVSRCISKGYGLARAKQALYEKRVPKQYWEDALADYPDMDEKIEDFLRSRLDGNSDQKDVKRAIDALMRRGHNYGAIRRALNQLRLEMDEFPEE
ncbi:MAG: RecX family transcriptional regulator [Oscillospiraceae bacterium]|nr:RecX family transcriptional regulator [Oscillospiraceae bacterium]